MHGVTKVFIAGFGGAFVATWAAPKIMPHLPASLQTGTMLQVTNGVIAGGSAAAVYYLLGAAGVKA